MKLTLTDNKLLKDSITVISDLVTEAQFKVTKDGMELVAMDPANVAILEDAVRAYRTETAATVVLATHNLPQARRLADRVAVILAGRVVEVGEAAAVLDHPEHPEAAAFLSGRLIC